MLTTWRMLKKYLLKEEAMDTTDLLLTVPQEHNIHPKRTRGSEVVSLYILNITSVRDTPLSVEAELVTLSVEAELVNHTENSALMELML